MNKPSSESPHSLRLAGAAIAGAVLVGVTLAACASSPAVNDPGKATPTYDATSGVEPPTANTMTVGGAKPGSAGEAESELTSAEKDLEKLIGTGPEPSPLSTDGCVNVCKAVASIKTAAEHVCALSADEPSRCESAKTRAARAEERAKSACPSCGT